MNNGPEDPGNASTRTARTQTTSISELIEKRAIPKLPPRMVAPTPPDRSPAAIPVLAPHQKLDLNALRHPLETRYYKAILIANVAFFVVAAAICIAVPAILLGVALLAAFLYVMNRLSFQLMYWFINGNSIRVSESQYPELHDAVVRACRYIDLPTVPQVFILHGEGLLELFVIKRFSKKGVLLFTSELVDTLLASGDSRQMMMIVGRQLGHIRAGHFKGWFFKDVIGRLALWFHAAWSRGCHYTADRVGYLSAGSLDASRRALIAMTVGKRLAPAASIDGIAQQAQEHQRSLFARIARILQSTPFMIHRIGALASFRDQVQERPVDSGDRLIGFLPDEVNHFEIIVHGHAIIGDSGVIKVVQPT